MHKTIWVHSKCGGELDTRIIGGRRCLKCKKRWSILSFIFTPSEVRPKMVKIPWEPIRKPTSYAKWADKVPLPVGQFASILPNWPRWARVLTGVGVVGLVTYLFILIRRYFRD